MEAEAVLKEKAHSGGSAAKNPPAMQKMWVRSVSQEGPLGWEMAPTPVFLPGNPWTEEPDGLQSLWAGRVGHDSTKPPSVVRKACP